MRRASASEFEEDSASLVRRAQGLGALGCQVKRGFSFSRAAAVGNSPWSRSRPPERTSASRLSRRGPPVRWRAASRALSSQEVASPLASTRRLAITFAAAARALVHQKNNTPLRKPCSGPRARPNPSLEATATGLALGPRTGQCHHPLRGPSANPASAPQLKR